MDQAQGAAGTGEAEQPTQTQPEPKAEQPLSPLQEAVRKEMGIESPIAEQPPKPEPEPEEQPEEQPEPEAEEPAEELPVAPEAQGETEAEPEVPDNWPKTAKARVAEEARKRRERTQERDQWKAEAERLNAQLQQAASVQLQPTKALTEVVDRQSLAAAEAHWKEIRRFARTNPDGADDVFLGKDAQGNEMRRDYSREEIIQMNLDADEAIEALPAKRAWVAEAEAQTEAAKQSYPDLFRDTDAGREAAAIVQQRPWILQVPDYAFVIGDYLAGRKARLAKQGKSAGKVLSPGAQAILGAPKVTPAPGVIKSRSASGGPGARGGGGERVDTKQADEEFYARGMTNEALEDKIRRKLAASQGGREGGKRAALV